MRLASLSVCLLAGALLVAAAADASRSSGDSVAVRQELKAAQTLEKALQAGTSRARATISFALQDCRGVQPAGSAKRERLTKLIALEGVRQLQHDALADYETFISAARKLHFDDRRLVSAQAALAAELAAARKVTGVKIDVCGDLKAFAKDGYSTAGLEAWARRIDRKAGLSEAGAAKTDRLVNASRPALRAAGLSAAEAATVLHAETGEVFVYAFAG